MQAIAGICRILCLLALCAISLAAKAQNPQTQPEISLVTLNLYHDKADWPKRLPLIVAELKRLNPDVVTLQEVIGRENLRNQAQTLAEALGYRYAFSSVDPEGQPQRYGNAILTRRPILAQHWTRLEPLDDSRTALHLRLAVGDRALNVYTTHLHWTDGGGAIRERQVADLMRFIADTRDGAPSLVAGDFNAIASAPELQKLTADFADSYGDLHPREAEDPKAHSTLNPAYYPPKRIDHIFLQRGAFAVASAQIVLNRAGPGDVWPSDHYGMQATLRFLPAKKRTRSLPERAGATATDPTQNVEIDPKQRNRPPAAARPAD